MNIQYIGVTTISLFAVPALIGLAFLAYRTELAGVVSRVTKAVYTFLQTHVFTLSTFFYLSTFVFMIPSMEHAGYFFDAFEGKADSIALAGFNQTAGLALALTLDVATFIFMRAMIVAKQRGEKWRAKRILLYITVCSSISTIGNLVHNLHFMDLSRFTGVPFFVGQLPYIASSPPLLIVAFASVAELLTEVNPWATLNPAAYREREEKKLEYISIQIEMKQRLADQQLQLAGVKQTERRAKLIERGKDPDKLGWVERFIAWKSRPKPVRVAKQKSEPKPAPNPASEPEHHRPDGSGPSKGDTGSLPAIRGLRWISEVQLAKFSIPAGGELGLEIEGQLHRFLTVRGASLKWKVTYNRLQVLLKQVDLPPQMMLRVSNGHTIFPLLRADTQTKRKIESLLLRTPRKMVKKEVAA